MSKAETRIGYVGAVQWLPVQQATLTFFTFPLLVGLARHCFGVEKMNRWGGLCLLAGFAGLALVVGRGEGGGAAGGDAWIGHGMAFGASALVATSFFVLRAARTEIAGMELTLWRLAAALLIFAAALINLEPVVSLLAAWTILDGRLAPGQWVGAALVIGAIVGMKKARALGRRRMIRGLPVGREFDARPAKAKGEEKILGLPLMLNIIKEQGS